MPRRAFARFVCLACFAGSFFLNSALSAAGVEFVRVWPAWRDAESFERIGEYFGRPEDTGGEVVLRTQPGTRAGYYFLVRVKSTAPSWTAGPARFELSVIRPDQPEAKTFSFPVMLREKETVFQLGLTGADWPGGKQANPVAWKLTLLGADGGVLTGHKSFLWAKPAE